MMLAHFGNCGMRTSLADNLNLTGAARHNLAIRYKRRLISLTLENTEERKKIPAAYEDVLCFFNHAELSYVNSIAIRAGISIEDLPFKHVEELQPDNGERFFSDCMLQMRQSKPKHDVDCRCLCNVCVPNSIAQQPTNKTSLQEESTTTINKDTRDVGAMLTHTTAAQTSQDKTVAPAPTNVLPTKTPINNVVQQQQQPQPQQQRCPQHHPQPQQQWQWQQQLAHALQWQQPQLQNMLCYTPMPQQMTPQPPWIMTTTMHSPAVMFCCASYRNWFNTVGRRGRPPHDGHCGRSTATRTEK